MTILFTDITNNYQKDNGKIFEHEQYLVKNTKYIIKTAFSYTSNQIETITRSPQDQQNLEKTKTEP